MSTIITTTTRYYVILIHGTKNVALAQKLCGNHCYIHFADGQLEDVTEDLVSVAYIDDRAGVDRTIKALEGAGFIDESAQLCLREEVGSFEREYSREAFVLGITTPKSAPVVRIFLTNLSRYAEGELVGTWLALPADPNVLAAAYAKIGTPEDEYFITDYESDFDGLTVGEYDNVDELNERAMTLAGLDDYEIECINAMLSEGYDFECAVDHIDDCVVWYGCSDMTDVAMQYCDECDILSSIPENLRCYFDYEAFGRDMSFEGQFVFTDSGNCVEICR